MLHTQIEHEEIVERYVGNRLKAEQRQAFEEHYFACDECFEKVQTMERFAAGIQDLARGDELRNLPARQKAPKWLVWALAGTSTAVVALGVLTGWAYLRRVPELQQQLRAAGRTQTNNLPEVARLQPEGSPIANVPLVVLEASRSEEVATAVLTPDATQLIVWIEVGPTRYRNYTMEVDSAAGTRILSIAGLAPGPYGALAASLPGKQLQPGTFQVKIFGQSPPPGSLVSEYRLQVRRP